MSYDADLHCKKIAWMGANGPDWDTENQTLEQYLETSADYPTDAQVAGFNHLWVEPFVPVKRAPYEELAMTSTISHNKENQK